VRTWNPRATISQFVFEALHEVCFKNVLNHVGIAINVTRCDVGMGYEIDLPESVVSCDAGGLAESGFGKTEFAMVL
jgi:hypothetical protein